MPMLSDDDLDIRGLSDEELVLAWDLWFDLAQSTNDDDPPYTHGVFQRVGPADTIGSGIAAGRLPRRPGDNSRADSGSD